MILYQALFQELLLIYQLPKTGSQTVEATLQAIPGIGPILRFHYLSPTMAAILRQGLRRGPANPVWESDVHAQLQLMGRLRLAIRGRKLLCRCGIRLPRLRVITAVREPIGLALSALFENYFHAFPSGPAALQAACREALLEPKTLKYIQEWFDLELRPMLGLDIFCRAFDCEKGYEVFENRFARVLVYRFDALAKLPEMLENFLGRPIPAVVQRNLSTTKDYADCYQAVKQALRLPAHWVAAQYQSRMMRHFYSDQERAEFCSRWADVRIIPPQSLSCDLLPSH